MLAKYGDLRPYASIIFRMHAFMFETKHKSLDIRGMDKLPLKTRAQILAMLCEGREALQRALAKGTSN